MIFLPRSLTWMSLGQLVEETHQSLEIKRKTLGHHRTNLIFVRTADKLQRAFKKGLAEEDRQADASSPGLCHPSFPWWQRWEDLRRLPPKKSENAVGLPGQMSAPGRLRQREPRTWLGGHHSLRIAKTLFPVP